MTVATTAVVGSEPDLIARRDAKNDDLDAQRWSDEGGSVISEAVAGSEFVMFSPGAQLAEVMTAMAANAQRLTAGR